MRIDRRRRSEQGLRSIHVVRRMGLSRVVDFTKTKRLKEITLRGIGMLKEV